MSASGRRVRWRESCRRGSCRLGGALTASPDPPEHPSAGDGPHPSDVESYGGVTQQGTKGLHWRMKLWNRFASQRWSGPGPAHPQRSMLTSSSPEAASSAVAWPSLDGGLLRPLELASPSSRERRPPK